MVSKFHVFRKIFINLLLLLNVCFSFFIAHPPDDQPIQQTARNSLTEGICQHVNWHADCKPACCSDNDENKNSGDSQASNIKLLFGEIT